jgi:hypothetical protein
MDDAMSCEGIVRRQFKGINPGHRLISETHSTSGRNDDVFFSMVNIVIGDESNMFRKSH